MLQATMNHHAELQIPLLPQHAFDESGEQILEAFTGDGKQRMQEIELAMLDFMATGRADKFYEPGIGPWLIAHLGPGINTRVQTLLALRGANVLFRSVHNTHACKHASEIYENVFC